jgi:hypothetical protein
MASPHRATPVTLGWQTWTVVFVVVSLVLLSAALFVG